MIFVTDPTRAFILSGPILVKRNHSYYRREVLREKYKRGIALKNKWFVYSFVTLYVIGAVILSAVISYMLRASELGYFTGFLVVASALHLKEDLTNLYPIETLYIRNRKK